MRKLVYYVAVSLDGYIARNDGGFDFFLQEGDHFAELFASYPETIPVHIRSKLGLSDEAKCFDTVLMGRATFEVGLKEGITNPYAPLRQIVFSRSLRESPDPNVEVVEPDDPVDFVRGLKAEAGKGKDIWLCGGADLASTLFPEIDELVLKVNPVLLGEPGIPLFAGSVGDHRLELAKGQLFGSGVLIGRYRVVRE